MRNLVILTYINYICLRFMVYTSQLQDLKPDTIMNKNHCVSIGCQHAGNPSEHIIRHAFKLVRSLVSRASSICCDILLVCLVVTKMISTCWRAPRTFNRGFGNLSHRFGNLSRCRLKFLHY